MQRFAKIKTANTRRKINIHAICRCCGLQSDDKEAILGQSEFGEDVEFKEKVSILTGKWRLYEIDLFLTQVFRQEFMLPLMTRCRRRCALFV